MQANKYSLGNYEHQSLDRVKCTYSGILEIRILCDGRCESVLDMRHLSRRWLGCIRSVLRLLLRMCTLAYLESMAVGLVYPFLAHQCKYRLISFCSQKNLGTSRQAARSCRHLLEQARGPRDRTCRPRAQSRSRLNPTSIIRRNGTLECTHHS